MTDTEAHSGVKLSVIVAVVSDTTDRKYDLSYLVGCLDALMGQEDPPPMEILVPYPSSALEFESLKGKYPQVIFLPINDLKSYQTREMGREHHDELRARGLAAAQGEIIGLLEDHALPDPLWCNQVVQAHLQNYAAVGGAIENDVDRLLNWAVYYCDFGKYQNPVPAGETSYASDANVSYKRSALFAIYSVWKDAFHETVVNWELISRGEKLALSPTIIVYQHRKNLRLGGSLKERFIWGQSYAQTRSKLISLPKRVFYAAISPVLPVILFLRTSIIISKKRRNLGILLKSSPLIIILQACWSMGELWGYLGLRST